MPLATLMSGILGRLLAASETFSDGYVTALTRDAYRPACLIAAAIL